MRAVEIGLLACHADTFDVLFSSSQHPLLMASLPPPPSDLLPDHTGAYIVKETQRAAEGSYENPIQAGIEATHANYDRCATLMLETVAKSARSNAVSPSHRLGGEGLWWPRRASRRHSWTANRRAFTCTTSSSITRISAGAGMLGALSPTPRCCFR